MEIEPDERGKVGPLMFMAAAVKWERAFVLSCIAVSLDPLFLYIPIVDETNKCLKADNNLRTIALILRSLTDFLLITHIIAQICHWVDTDYPKYSWSEHTEPSPHLDPEFDPDPEALNPVVKFVKHKLPWSIIIKFLAVLPVPQVAILVGFFRMRGCDFFINRKLLNVAVLLQYVPRVCQIYLTRHKFRMPGKWVKLSFNLFLYILASHVLGALWYYFAIERETSCWYKACKRTKNAGCANRVYNCGSSDITTNITLFLDQLCPINSPNSTLFDFGIFVKILQSGNTGSDKFATKFLYSLWWGLKNLSNFGTNLETSSYMWENYLAILICVIGLLLCIYLIGNVQLYIQSVTHKSLDREKSRTQSIQKKKADITNWMENKFLPDHDELRKRIKRDIREDKVVEKNLAQDVDVAYFLNSVTTRIREAILEHLGVAALKKVPKLQDIMDDTKLKRLCKLMEPVVYKPNSNVVIPKLDLLDKMLFIIEGELICTDPQMNQMIVKKNEYYGQDILEWALLNYTTRSYYDHLPPSPRIVKAGPAKVEALGLDAWNLLRFIEENVDINSPQLTHQMDTFPPRQTDQMHTQVGGGPRRSPLPRPPRTAEEKDDVPLMDMNTSSTDPAHTTQDSGNGGNRQDRGSNRFKNLHFSNLFSGDWKR